MSRDEFVIKIKSMDNRELLNELVFYCRSKDNFTQEESDQVTMLKELIILRMG